MSLTKYTVKCIYDTLKSKHFMRCPLIPDNSSQSRQNGFTSFFFPKENKSSLNLRQGDVPHFSNTLMNMIATE